MVFIFLTIPFLVNLCDDFLKSFVILVELSGQPEKMSTLDNRRHTCERMIQKFFNDKTRRNQAFRCPKTWIHLNSITHSSECAKMKYSMIHRRKNVRSTYKKSYALTSSMLFWISDSIHFRMIWKQKFHSQPQCSSWQTTQNNHFYSSKFYSIQYRGVEIQMVSSLNGNSIMGFVRSFYWIKHKNGIDIVWKWKFIVNDCWKYVMFGWLTLALVRINYMFINNTIGQWSLPRISDRIKLSTTFGFKFSETIE